MPKIQDTYCRFQDLVAGLEVTYCTRIQVDSSYTYGVMVPEVIFDLSAPSDPIICDDHPEMNRHLTIC